MAVTNLQITLMGGGRYRATWSMTGSTAYKWRDGILVGTTTGTTWELSVSPGETVEIAVFDDAVSVQGNVYPGRMVIQWAEVTTAAQYRIEEYVVDTWTLRESRLSHGDGRRYEYTARFLEDETTHQFRVVPVSAAGIDGTPEYFLQLMCRRPDKPSVSLSLTAGGNVYVEAA
jgi:hypothetical protein